MSTINKPLPHRPFSLALAGNPERPPRRQHQPQMTSVSNLRPYVPVNDKLTITSAPVPKRTHLVTRSPSPPYSHAASDALPSSRPNPSHSFSEPQSHSRTNHNSYNSAASTSNLVPPHLRQQSHTASFWRRHWNRIARLCYQSNNHSQHHHHKRVRHQQCDWRSPALRRAY